MTRGYKPRKRTTLADVAGRLKKAPPAPASLAPNAVAVWEEIAPALYKSGLANAANGTALEAYCNAVALLRDCQAAIARDGSFPVGKSGPKAHPALKLSIDATKAIKSLATHLGLIAPPYAPGRKGPSAATTDALTEMLGE